MIPGVASTRTLERPAIRRRHSRRTSAYRRERLEFGGRIQWEAVFFGLLAAIGLGASLIAMVLGGLVAAGVTDFHQDAASLIDRMAAGGGAIAVAILALAYLAGGYVAARMARFDGVRQGLGVWLLSALLILGAAITAWIAGGKLDPSDSITLPSNPIDKGPLHDDRWPLAVVAVLVPLVFAVLGGMLGERFHRAVDRAGVESEHGTEPGAAGEQEGQDTDEHEDYREAETEPDRDQPTAEQEETRPVVWP
jgi:hypothetical protein